MNIKQMQYVLTIRDCKSFSQAAKELFISQPSLSQYVINLEKQLGATLFDRSTSPLQLTYAGEIYVEHAEHILDCYKQMEQKLSDMSYTPRGLVTVGTSQYVTAHIMSRILLEFKQKYPDIGISLRETLQEQRQEAALKGEIDLFFNTYPIENELFEYVSVLTERILLALPPNHRLVKPGAYQYQHEVAMPALWRRDYYKAAPPFEDDFPSISLSELRNDSFAMTKPGMSLYEITVALCRKLGFEPKIALESRSIDVLRSMALTGIGVAFVPESIVRFSSYIKQPIFYNIQEEYIVRNLSIAYRKGRYLSRSAQEFITSAAHVLKTPVSSLTEN